MGEMGGSMMEEVGGGRERLEKLVAGEARRDGVKLVAVKAKRD